MTLRSAPADRGWLFYLVVLALAIAAYLHGLDGRYIPKNGDEGVYMHIARLTADSGHWLPLQSALDGMRNTKPPMLFWQALVSTDWGQHWDFWHLRWPSVLYTALTAVLCFLLARRMTGRTSLALVASLAWLAFFSTYRYGRPYLTNPPEIFWLFLPFFTLIMAGRRAFESRFLMPVLFGVMIGIGLLYKSFALIAPVGFALVWWHGHERGYRPGRFLLADAPKIAITTVVALALFGLWFALDPDPASVWREFVIGENAQKFEAEGGYLKTLVWGGSSIWSLALNYPLNAGLLAVPMAWLFVSGWRHRHEASRDEIRLWIWVAVFFIVFALPSQRSGRYLMPAMPALAVLLAVHWSRIGRSAFAATALLAGLVVALFGWLAYRLQVALPGQALYGAALWLLLALCLVVVLVGLASRRSTRLASLGVVFLVYLAFSALVAPFEGRFGQFSAPAQAALVGRDVWVPCNFRSSHEAHRLLLPGANVLGYDDSAAPDAADLGRRYSHFVLRVPIGGAACAGCQVLGERLEIRSRHSPAELAAIRRGEIFENLFVRELLVKSSEVASAGQPTPETASQCR